MSSEERTARRIDELLVLGDRVLATKRSPPPNVISDARVDQQLAAQWVASVEALLLRSFGFDSAHYAAFKRHTDGHIGYSDVLRAQGVLRAAADDFAGGYLFDMRRLIEADVFDDLLEQAQQLHASGYHPAAAVVAGCVLEDSLRKICDKQSIQLPTKPKLDRMNSDLAKAGVYSKLVQKRITALADLRNKAAHGQWNQFNADDVDDMIRAVRRTIEELY